MDVRRKRFIAALTLFVVWVACLATLAVISSRKPPASPVAKAER